MVTGSLGTSNVRFPKPSFTYTKTLSNLPPSTTTVSAIFMPLQAGSWVMSIFAALGAAPSKLTVPLTLAAVAGSIGAAAGAAIVLGAADCSSVGFLLHAVIRTRPTTAHRPRVTNQCLRFIISLHLSEIGMKALAYSNFTARRLFPTFACSRRRARCPERFHRLASYWKKHGEKFCSCWIGCAPWLRPHGAALPERAGKCNRRAAECDPYHNPRTWAASDRRTPSGRSVA